MDKDNLVRLLIIEDDLNDAETLVSTVRSAGFAVRPERPNDHEHLDKLLAEHSPDMVLCTVGVEALALEDVTSAIAQAGRRVPIIALTNDANASIAECMRAGAQDLVRKNDSEHLKLVVQRTAECQRYWRELKKFQSAARESEKRCKTLLDSSRDAIAYVHEGMHVYANESYLELFGYTDIEEVEGTPLMDLVSRDAQQTLKEFLRDYAGNAASEDNLDIKLRHAGGQHFDAQMEFSPARIDGEPCTQIVIRDQANAKELEEQLHYLSQRDLLTGLYNRQYFMEEMENAIGKATQGQGNSAVIHLSLNNFHEVKQAVGVSGSDIVVNDIGRMLENRFGSTDLISRYGGESFSILTPQWETHQLRNYADRLMTTVSEHICEVEGKSVALTASIAAVPIDENAPETNELLSRLESIAAEAAAAKGTAVIYQPKQGEMNQKELDAIWNKRVQDAIKDNRLKLVFQPVVSLHGDPGERYEAFLRLYDENGNAVAPTEFLDSVERSGLNKVLDDWVITNAIETLARRREQASETIFFINLTAGSLQDKTMLRWINQQLKKYRLPAECLVFELQESTVVQYLRQAREFVKGLKELHCRFAIDNFGTGLNPFQLIKHLPADFVRIDGTLMDDLTQNSENQQIIRSITQTAHSMNILTIAQHVEDANILSVLWGMGVNYIQGNFLQPPSANLNYDFSAMA